MSHTRVRTLIGNDGKGVSACKERGKLLSHPRAHTPIDDDRKGRSSWKGK